MSSDVLQFIGTKNARLAKFCDHNHNIAGVLMKIVTHCELVARERGKVANEMQFDCRTSPDGKLILIKLKV